MFFLFQIRSDNEKDDRIHYSLEGVGASKYPFNVFIVDPITGYIRLTKKLDREEISHYNVSFLLVKPQFQCQSWGIVFTVQVHKFTACVCAFQMSGVATYTDGTHAERKIDIRIKVLDENDNPPVFAKSQQGSVKELSPAGTSSALMVNYCTLQHPQIFFLVNC